MPRIHQVPQPLYLTCPPSSLYYLQTTPPRRFRKMAKQHFSCGLVVCVCLSDHRPFRPSFVFPRSHSLREFLYPSFVGGNCKRSTDNRSGLQVGKREWRRDGDGGFTCHSVKWPSASTLRMDMSYVKIDRASRRISAEKILQVVSHRPEWRCQ